MTVTLSREKHTVTNARRPVRSERSSQPMPVVAVTGAAAGIGYALAVRLAASSKVRGAETVLTAAAAGRVGRVVLLTSSMIYGARPDNPVTLPEDARLAADADSSVAGDLLDIEHLARRSPRSNPGVAVTVIRPAALVGESLDTL